MSRSALLAAIGLFLTPSITAARTWHILPDGTGDAPTIQAGIYSATVGDTLLLGCGTFFEHDISMRSQIAIVGEVPGCVNVDAQGLGRVFDAHGTTGASFLGLNLQDGVALHRGGGIWLDDSHATIETCVFLNNNVGATGGAISAVGATLTIKNSHFVGNQADQNGGAIRSVFSHLSLARCVFEGNEASGTGGALTFEGTNSITIEDCLFQYNIARYSGAIHATNSTDIVIRKSLFVGNQVSTNGGALYSQNGSHISVDACTFWGNAASTGATLCLLGGTIEASNSVVAGSTLSEAVYCEGGSHISLACCDVYGNAGGDWTGCISDLLGVNGNFSADPLFCDPDAGDFTIRSNSPCAPPGVTGCGLIGALPVGCGPVNMEGLSWGRIKAAHR